MPATTPEEEIKEDKPKIGFEMAMKANKSEVVRGSQAEHTPTPLLVPKRNSSRLTP